MESIKRLKVVDNLDPLESINEKSRDGEKLIEEQFKVYI